jgi:DNA-binding SARP family transcriptional activator/tetratricopeptide (TPR) repeat protein
MRAGSPQGKCREVAEQSRRGLGQETASGADDKVVPIELGRATRPARQAARQPRAHIQVLGAMRAVAWTGRDLVPRSRKARALLGYLCLHPGESVARNRLAALLWDRVPDAQAATSFRQAWRELSLAMGPLAKELMAGERSAVSLDAASCWIDAQEALASGWPFSSSAGGDLAAHRPGELLEGMDGISVSFDHWLLTERTRFTGRLRERLEADLKAVAGRDAEGRAAAARRVIAFDPTHEGAARVLMRALVEMGERAQALHEYERCRDAVRSSLDVEPSSETRALHQALRTFSSVDASLAVTGPAGGESQDLPLRASSRLRVLVKPFQALAPHLETLTVLLSLEVAAGLARFRWFDVIAPASYREGPLLPQNRSEYIVEGSLSGNAQCVQISVRLLDVIEQSQLVWSDRFEMPAAEIDELNERIIGPVVARIDPVILFIEGQRRKGQQRDAESLVLKAIPLMYSMERDKYEAAGRLIAEALKAEDANADANANVLAWAAYWQVWYVGQGWANDPVQAFATAQDHAVRAIRADPENAEALGIYGHICAFLDKDFEAAMHYFDRALQLNPNLAFIWALSAPTCCYTGQPDLALRRLDRYRELAPTDPLFPLWEYFYAIAYFFKGDYEQTVVVGRRAAKANPDFVNGYKPLIAALGHLGRAKEAAPYIARLLRLEPGFTVASFGSVYPFRKPFDRDHYMQGLLLAGVPSG